MLSIFLISMIYLSINCFNCIDEHNYDDFNLCIYRGPNCGNNGGSVQCLCIEGCGDFRVYDDKCRNLTNSKPSIILKCPGNCTIDGDKCIGIRPNTICNRTQCSNNCHYDLHEKICTRNVERDIYSRRIIPFRSDNNIICEPTVIMTCPYGTFLTKTKFIGNCAYNQSGICTFGDYSPANNCNSKSCDYKASIQYPLRLQNKYSDIMCKHSYGNCFFNRKVCCN